jgi:anthranilate/para-aminobenzoate synthase component II
MVIISKKIEIAVLINHPPTAHFWTEVRQAFIDSFAIISRDIELDFYDPIDKQEYPSPHKYDLVILSGGKADASASDPWILKELEFVRSTARESPETKILGICWGHQALLRAFGGHVAAVPTGPIVSHESMNDCYLIRLRLV